MAKHPISSQIIADVGISLGDEGKGRLIPEVIADLRIQTGDPAPVAVVLKVNGGANSGHTCGGLKLNLFPAGVVDRTVDCLAIGAGVVADPRKFIWEARYIEHAGFEVMSRLLIDERTMLSDLSHRVLDLAWESYRANVLKETPRGSTGRGISPAYMEETAHFQMYYMEFLGCKDRFAQRMRGRLDRASRTVQHVCQVTEEKWHEFFSTLTVAEERANKTTIDAGLWPADEFKFERFKGAAPFTFNADAVIDTYWETGQKLAASIGEVRERVLRALHNKKYVVGEFGQSYWLGKRTGFSPNQTASHTYTPEFFQSAGVPLQPIHTIGVCKAYDTKVGTHTYISKMPDEHPLCEQLKLLEFGTSTGRQRMVGWFDAVEKGDALRYGGFQELMINKLDALSYSKNWNGGDLLICTAYKTRDGSLIHHVPRDGSVHQQLSPVFTQHPGWAEDISNVRHFADLPLNARHYVGAMVKSILDVAYEGQTWPAELPRLRYLGVGPDPDQVIRDLPETAELF
ncbi:MAG: adenylosuccinate synthetase [Verrucomicrobiota bacterium]|nr:adenylosuccinate synthetase [Verrucomicrobiota bacterium]